MNDGRSRSSARAAQSPSAADGDLRTYLRLLGYVRPYRAQFAIGVLGAILYAATQASFAWLAKLFGDHTLAARDPRSIT